MSNSVIIISKSIFKNTEEFAITRAYTNKWIELINWYEKQLK